MEVEPQLGTGSSSAVVPCFPGHLAIQEKGLSTYWNQHGHSVKRLPLFILLVLFSSIRRHEYSELLEQMSLLRSRLDISFFKSHSTRQICRQCCNKCQDSRHPPFFSAAGGLAGKALHKFQHTPVKWQVWSSAIAEEPELRFPEWQYGRRVQSNPVLSSVCDQRELCDHTGALYILAGLPAVLSTSRWF